MKLSNLFQSFAIVLLSMVSTIAVSQDTILSGKREFGKVNLADGKRAYSYSFIQEKPDRYALQLEFGNPPPLTDGKGYSHPLKYAPELMDVSIFVNGQLAYHHTQNQWMMQSSRSIFFAFYETSKKMSQVTVKLNVVGNSPFEKEYGPFSVIETEAY